MIQGPKSKLTIVKRKRSGTWATIIIALLLSGVATSRWAKLRPNSPFSIAMMATVARLAKLRIPGSGYTVASLVGHLGTLSVKRGLKSQ